MLLGLEDVQQVAACAEAGQNETERGNAAAINPPMWLTSAIVSAPTSSAILLNAALGVFVCEDRSEQFKNFEISVVFGRNQFDAVLLTAPLAAERRCDFGIVDSKVCAE